MQPAANHPSASEISTSQAIERAQGKWALVTGASRGIGREVALALADAGVNVAVVSRSLAGTADVVTELENKGVEATAFAVDLANPTAVKQLADKIVAQLEIDYLYNNAGINAPFGTTAGTIDPDAWQAMYLVNVIAPTILIETILQGMLARGFGRIINTTSGIQDIPCSYAASKGALNKLTRDYAATLSGTGVTMSVLDPGWIRTELGGPDAPNDVATVIPGAIVSGFGDESSNGAWVNAQDFTGLTLSQAIASLPNKQLRIAITEA